MLRTIQATRTDNQILRLVAIAIFVALMAISAKISFNFGAVPFTMQVFVVLLSGMVLGSRDGLASQISYLGLIMLGLPLDARGLGAAVFFSSTWGYLLGFAVAAFVMGWLAENGARKIWQRFLAGIVGIVVIYAFGIPVLKYMLGMDWQTAWTAGAVPFFALDLLKALLAAMMVEVGRSLLLRNSELIEEKSKN